MKSLLIGAALAGALTGLAGAASAAPSQTNNCFLSSNWNGWHAPDDKTLYLRVSQHDLNSPSAMLNWPSSHLVNVVRGSNYICSPLDLDLSVVENNGGPRDFLFVKAITKLTPDEVAVIPRKDLP
jgi:hypothetical protein